VKTRTRSGSRPSRLGRVFFLLVAALFALVPRVADAADPSTVRLALIVGVNRSVDTEAPPLRFADDDAARYFDLFETLADRAVILARPDENTRRLHPRAAEQSTTPTASHLDEAVLALAARVAEAKKSGMKTALYFVYAGHGNVKNGTGYIALEDARLTGEELQARVLRKIEPDTAHFIVDACYSYFLAYARGPGGQRREFKGFSDLGALGQQGNVGVLLSTSSARESHEWERVQSGVFSHEVRSGLYGAADADGDGQITYREIAAFVQRANATIPNERFRPDLYARPPPQNDVLLDLHGGLARRIEVDGASPAHYVLENQDGVYLAEFHNGPSEAVRLVRPKDTQRLFLARTDDGREFVIEREPDVIRTASLTLASPRHQARGAAHESFSKTFELPFGTDAVRAFQFGAPPPTDETAADEGSRPSWRRYAGFGLLGLGAAGAAVGGYSLYSAHALGNDAGPQDSQADISERNRSIRAANTTGGVALGLGAAAVGSGMLLLLWPDSPVTVQAGAWSRGAGVQVDGAF
jgi:Caspase domain